jgi:hypothetical protein
MPFGSYAFLVRAVRRRVEAGDVPLQQALSPRHRRRPQLAERTSPDGGPIGRVRDRVTALRRGRPRLWPRAVILAVQETARRQIG